MAGSTRRHQFGSIFSRMTGLLRSGAVKEEDRPLWYDIYQRLPPKIEPRHDQPVDVKPVAPILYPEDAIRAKFYEKYPGVLGGVIDMDEGADKSLCQTFVEMYLSECTKNKDRSDDELWDTVAEKLGLFTSETESRGEDIQRRVLQVSGGLGQISVSARQSKSSDRHGHSAGKDLDLTRPTSQTGIEPSILAMYQKAMEDEAGKARQDMDKDIHDKTSDNENNGSEGPT